MVKAVEMFDGNRFCFQLKDALGFVAHIVDQQGAQSGDMVYGQGVCEFTGADSPKLTGTLKGQIKLGKEVMGVDKKGEPGLVQIGLEDAVYAIHGAAHADIEHMVIAAAILSGARAGLKETAPVFAEDKVLFTRLQVFGKRAIGDRRIAAIRNNLGGKLGPFADFMDIGQVGTAFFNKDLADMVGRVIGYFGR